MVKQTTGLMVVAATLVSAGLGLAPGGAAAQGYSGPGRDYQPPAHDRDDASQGRAADRRRQGGAPDNIWASPLYDREPYGYVYSGAGADRLRPDPYERGYRMGREDERRRAAMQGGYGGPAGYRGGQDGGLSDGGPEDQGVLILLIERDRQQQAMRDVRQSLQEARTALQQGDRGRAEQALNQADQTLRQANALRNQQQVERSLSQAEQALQSGDRQAAQQALQQARQAMRDSGGGGGGGAQPQPGQQPASGQTGSGTPAGPSAGGGAQPGSGASPAPGGGQGTR